MKANSLDLNIDVDLNSSNAIHNGEEPKMKRKSSWVYEGLLRSYTKDIQTSYPLPYGHKASISASGSTLTIDEQSYSLSSNTINKVKQLMWIDDDVITSGVDSDGNVYRSTKNALYKNNDKVYTGTSSVSHDALAYTEGTTLYYSGNTYTLSFAPNYIEINSTYLVYGYSVSDQYQCRWAARLLSDLSTDNASGSYLGCVGLRSDGIIVTGEPYYLNLSPTRLANGVLRWTFDSTDRSTAITNNKAYSDSLSSEMPLNPGDLSAATQNYDYTGRSVSYGNASIRYAVLIKTSISYLDSNVDNGCFLTMDPNASPGVFWSSTVSEYQNIFPYMYLFTNVVTNRGSTYDYGRGWFAFYQEVGGYSPHLSYTVSGHTVGFATVWYSTDSTFFNLNGNVLHLDCRVDTRRVDSTYSQYVDDDGNFWGITSGLTSGASRDWGAVYSVKEDKAWPSLYHIIGGTNSGDQGLASTFPFNIGYINGLKVLHYSGIPVALSYNNVLLNTSTTDGLKNYASNGSYVLIDNVLYKIGNDEIKITKIADNMYTTNSLTNDNLIVVSEDNVSVQKCYIDYNFDFTFNDSFLYLSLYEPTSSNNDVWMQGMGYNPNMKDTVNASSYLYPAIEIPLFISSSSIDEFNKAVLDNNNPILRAVNTLAYPVDVYYTHTLKSTDVTYKYTIESSLSSYNSDLKDNSWTATSTLIIYPLGIVSVLFDESGRNTASPSIDMKNKYAARLYSSNNSYFVSMNSTSQVYKGTEIFTIYTSSYYFDGQSIYFVGGTNETTSNSFVCYALGMTFIGASGTEAYFWSETDKSIYLFSGSTTLTKWKEMTGVDEIYDTCFFPAEQRLYMLLSLNGKDSLAMIDSSSAALFDGANSSFNMTDEAVYFTSDDNKYVAYSPYKFDRIPLEIETEWIGDPTKLFNFGYMEYNLYKVNDKAVNIHIEADTLYDQNVDRTKRDITIKKDDWKSDMYRLRVSPANPVGNAVKYILTTDNDVAIQNMTFALDDASDNMAVRR